MYNPEDYGSECMFNSCYQQRLPELLGAAVGVQQRVYVQQLLGYSCGG